MMYKNNMNTGCSIQRRVRFLSKECVIFVEKIIWLCVGYKCHEGNPSVAFLKGKKPTESFVIESELNDGTSIPYCMVVNSCPQILHHDCSL